MEKLRIVVHGLDLNTTADLIQDLRKNNLEFEFVVLDAIQKEYKEVITSVRPHSKSIIVAILSDSCSMVDSTQRLAEKAQEEFNAMFVAPSYNYFFEREKQTRYQREQNKFRARQYR